MHEPSGLESLGGSRVLAGAFAAWAPLLCRAQLHTEQEKIFTAVVDTWRVGINQHYLYSSDEYLIFAWLFQRKKVAYRGQGSFIFSFDWLFQQGISWRRQGGGRGGGL